MKKKFKVGDKIVELGQVYRIFKIEEKKGADGKPERVIFFKPYYQTEEIQTVICSIPIKNICLSHIRRPLKREEVSALVEKLRKEKHTDIFCDLNKAKTLLKSNDPSDTVVLLHLLHTEKMQELENFSKSKRDILNEVINILVQEFALVRRISLKKAREEIDLALE